MQRPITHDDRYHIIVLRAGSDIVKLVATVYFDKEQGLWISEEPLLRHRSQPLTLSDFVDPAGIDYECGDMWCCPMIDSAVEAEWQSTPRLAKPIKPGTYLVPYTV